jgi:hypothetical protein
MSHLNVNIMTTEELFAKFKPQEDAVIKRGIDCLYEKLGAFDAEDFLDLYHIRRIEESRGVNYTEWRRDNLWAGMSVDDICQMWKNRQKTTATAKQQVEATVLELCA